MITHGKPSPKDNRVFIGWGLDDRSQFVLSANATSPCRCGSQVVTKLPWTMSTVGHSITRLKFPAELTEEEALQRALTVVRRYEYLPLVYFPGYMRVDGMGFITGKTTDGLLKVRQVRHHMSLKPTKFKKTYYMEMHDADPRTETALNLINSYTVEDLLK